MQHVIHARTLAALASIGLSLTPSQLRAEPSADSSTALVEATVKQLVGCFQVQFNFVEDGEHDAIYPPVYERADLTSEKPLTISRTLILGPIEQPHWSEVWTEVASGQWQQEVTGPYGDFRYKCTAPWALNQWSCEVKGAAKPRRDKDRPYATLDRVNTLQVNGKRWIQAEQNRKITASGSLYSIEVGWNQYERVDASFCNVEK